MKDKPWKKILVNTGSLSVIQAIGDFSGLILYVVLSRYFGPEGIGLYAFGYSIALISFFIIVFGFDDYGIRECALIDQNARRKLLGEIISIQLLLLGSVLILVTLFILITAPPEENTIVIYSMLFYLIALAFSRIFFIPSNSQQKMITPALVELLVKSLSVIAASILIIFLRLPIYYALLSYPATGIIAIAFGYISLRNYTGGVKLIFRFKKLFVLIKTVWPFSASLMIYPVYTRAGLITLTFMMGNAAAGLYAPSQKFVEVGLMPVIFFCFSVYPVLSKYFVNDKVKFEDSSEKYFRAILIFAAFFLWVLFYIVPLIIIPLFGSKFSNSILLVKYFSILIFIFSLTKGLHKILLAANLQLDRIKYESIVLIINIILNIALIPFFGAAGAIFALIISESSLTILFIYVIKERSPELFRIITISFKEFVISFSITLLAAILISYTIHSEYFAMITTLLLFPAISYITGFMRKFDIHFFKPSLNKYLGK